jgi:histidinol dehydrogenase
MNILLHSETDFAARFQKLLASSSLFDPHIEQQTRAIIQAVQERGDGALVELTERFNGVKLTPDNFAVSQAELMAASVQADPGLRRAVAQTSKNVETFARRSLRKDWSMRNSHGAAVGEKFDPITRVGIYIPGGMAPLVSTALMTVPLARVAGCAEIVVCTPCDSRGSINPALLYAARHAGATEIYRVGGAQAIAAMALGTPAIAPVRKIFGPGNAYVVAAKRLLFGHVAIDLLPGPSELLVLADDTGNPACIAADLLAQAEHGSGHERVWLVTASPKLAPAVRKQINRQLPRLKRRELIELALERNGWLLQVADLEQGIELTNLIAPEHLEIITRNAAAVAKKIVTAGAIFLGGDSPTVLGDYVAGPSHTLPAGGTGASFSGLTVDQFQRRTSLVQYNRTGLKAALPAVKKFAELEGLDAHGYSAQIRLEQRRGPGAGPLTEAAG